MVGINQQDSNQATIARVYKKVITQAPLKNWQNSVLSFQLHFWQTRNLAKITFPQNTESDRLFLMKL